MLGSTSASQVAESVDQVNSTLELAGSPDPVMTIGVPVTPWSGVTVRLAMVAGVVKAAVVTPVNGNAATPGMPVGAVSV